MKRLQRRLARDLHDDLCASLSNICFMSGMAAQNLTKGDQDQAAAVLDRIGAAASEAHASIGDSIAILGDSCSQLGHLAALLNRNGYELLLGKGIEFSLSLPEALRTATIPATRRRDLYLILKEALHNVMRHSCADEVQVTFEADGRYLYCRVTDNGCGFDAERPYSGNGLKNMRRRAALIGGKLRFFSKPGRGCTLFLQIPLRPFWRPLRLTPHVRPNPSDWYAAAQAPHKPRSPNLAKKQPDLPKLPKSVDASASY